jgi:hypothetical protein
MKIRLVNLGVKAHPLKLGTSVAHN